MQTLKTDTHSIREIIERLQSYVNRFSFVLRDDIEVGESAKSILTNLSSFLIDIKDVQEWPGTKLLLGRAKLYVYHLNEQSASIIYSYSDNLYDWVQPAFPEDLIFGISPNPTLTTTKSNNYKYISRIL